MIFLCLQFQLIIINLIPIHNPNHDCGSQLGVKEILQHQNLNHSIKKQDSEQFFPQAICIINRKTISTSYIQFFFPHALMHSTLITQCTLSCCFHHDLSFDYYKLIFFFFHIKSYIFRYDTLKALPGLYHSLHNISFYSSVNALFT